MASLQVQNVHRWFGPKEVLRGISFHVKSGDIVSIIGPSGCGKTTLLRCILGELAPHRGRILVDGQDVTRQKVWRRGVGIVYQGYALFPHMTARENIEYGLRAHKTPEAERKQKVSQLLELVHLNGKGDQFPHRLSGGEKQRVALARALAVAPRVLLLDEAFTALDATTKVKVIQEVRGIIRRLGLTTVLITHDQEEAFIFARHVVVLNEGRIVVEGGPDHVMKHPHPFIQSFVKMALFHTTTVKRDPQGQIYAQLDTGQRIPIQIPGVKVGDAVQVMIKKGPERETVEVWPRETP